MSYINLEDVRPDIGEVAYQILKDKYPGYRISVDKKKMKFRTPEEQESYCKNAFYSGQTLDEIADDVGLSPKYVGKIVRKK